MTFKNINSKAIEAELSKLISLGYDLYKDNLQHFDNECNMFPRLYITDDLPYATCRIKDGIIFGLRGFSSHSNSNVFTHLGLSVGNICNNKLNLNYSIVFSVNSNNNRISISMLQKNKDTEYQPDLITTSKWDKLTETEQLNLFIKSMTILGFNEQDVKNIINGSMKAIDAYMNIVPEDKKNKRWCIYGRHYFEFDGNTLIYGNCSIINNVDEFPFPLKGNIIIDCNRANTSMINIKKIKQRL